MLAPERELITKHKHWRAFQAIYATEAAPVIEFHLQFRRAPGAWLTDGYWVDQIMETILLRFPREIAYEIGQGSEPRPRRLHVRKQRNVLDLWPSLDRR